MQDNQDKSLNELSTLVEIEKVDVKLSTGEVLLISEITIREFPSFIKIVKRLLPKGLTKDKEKTIEEQLLEVVMEDPDALLELVSVCSKMEKTKLDTLSITDLILIATAIIEVNLDFFMKKVLPVIGIATERIATKAQQLGA